MGYPDDLPTFAEPNSNLEALYERVGKTESSDPTSHDLLLRHMPDTPLFLGTPPGSPYTWTNMPSATTSFGGVAFTWSDTPIDLTGRTLVRIFGALDATAGAPGAQLGLQVRRPFDGTFYGFDGTPNVLNPTIGIETPNAIFGSAWWPIAELFQGDDMHVFLFGQGGDGVVDPTFVRVGFQVR